ncbi:glycoside hydrolase [Teratosphaeria nubilosa]|uniref:Glycoside hydrolase n=1 Tax=Teratosphaeria nubilosa TaxID=161662 RepID=A0A6G1LIP6_9PEZI|nr:glycoside hydrolase [Teratosphaeria nubilosa]
MATHGEFASHPIGSSAIFPQKRIPRPGENVAIKDDDNIWWKNVVCYQVWPMSFLDSNGDGYGDIPGIISKLDYLKDLGIDCIWISPTYDSPMEDWGYDISDYEKVHPRFGTLKDLEQLIQEVHKRDMRILLDLVVTHTSDQHPWFQESKKSRDNARGKNNKHDWFIWRDELLEAPSNYKAAFGGSAWTKVESRDQYYMHLFLESQPDLNWECAEMREALFKTAVDFWLEKGVDGFRVDTANRFSKDPNFPDAEIIKRGKWQPGSKYYINGSKMHTYWKEHLRKHMDDWAAANGKKEEIMLVGELPLTTEDEVMEYVLPENREITMIFDFDMIKLGHHDNPDEYDKHEVRHLCDGDPSFTLPLFKSTLMKVQRMICEKGGWGTLFMENHDQCRSIPRYATPKPEYWREAGKLLALLQTTLTGTLFIYQGQEIGMKDMPHHWSANDFRDPDAVTYLREFVRDHHREDPMAERTAMEGIFKVGRDNSRTPMQWDASANAGFTGHNPPWMPVNENKDWLNVRYQQESRRSIWSFWKDMIQLRKERRDLFMHGTFACHDYDNQQVFTYTKMNKDGRTAIILLNFSDHTQPLNMIQSHLIGHHSDMIKSTRADPDENLSEKSIYPLEPWEGRLYLQRKLVEQDDTVKKVNGGQHVPSVVAHDDVIVQDFAELTPSTSRSTSNAAPSGSYDEQSTRGRTRRGTADKADRLAEAFDDALKAS